MFVNRCKRVKGRRNGCGKWVTSGVDPRFFLYKEEVVARGVVEADPIVGGSGCLSLNSTPPPWSHKEKLQKNH